MAIFGNLLPSSGVRAERYGPACAHGVTKQLGVSRTSNELLGAWRVLGRAWGGGTRIPEDVLVRTSYAPLR